MTTALTHEQPRLRPDLHWSRQETAEGTVFVVKDPLTGRFFRFKEAEHFIAQALDGATAPEIVRRRAEERFAARVSPETIEGFLGTLRRLELLEPRGPQGDPAPRRQARLRGSLLYLRLKAFDPDRLFGFLAGKLGFFFTPYFLAASVILILSALAITAANWDAIELELRRLYRFQTILWAWLTVLLVIVAHEFAHGLTCKRFGGEVHEIGFLLIYFQPAFYCNVSDAWLIPERSRRLWVTFAGAYFELVLWAIATLLWRVTEPSNWLSSAALVVMATSAIKSFFNLNPLIKLDGYYLLSDFLEVPNLRERSFRYLGGRIRRLWGGAAPDGLVEAPPRERRIYLAYALLAGPFSIWLLSYVLSYFGGFLVGRYQAPGFILFLVLLMVMFRRQLRKLLPGRAPWSKGGRTTSPPARWARRMAMLALLLAAASGVLFLGKLELKVSGEFAVLPSHNADVRAEVEGIIEEVFVDQGDPVHRGDLIARLSSRDSLAELRQVQAETDEKRAKLKMLKAGPRPVEVELARKGVETARTRQEQALKRHDEAGLLRAERLTSALATVRKTQERLKYARGNLDRFTTLLEDGLISKKEFEEVEEQFAVREKELEEAQAAWKLVAADDLGEFQKELAVAEKELAEADGRLGVLLAGSRPEEIEATEAEVARLEARRRHLEEQIELARVVSPHSGVITTPKLREKVGQHVKQGDLLAEAHELSTITAEIAIAEQEIAEVRTGQPVILKARAHPGLTFSGVVTAIAPAIIEDEPERPGKVVKVTTTIENGSLLLKSHMTGYAKVLCGERTVLDLVTRRLSRYLRVEFWSWW